MDFPQARLLVFAKAPVPGQVKTRLIRTLGPHGAANLHKTLLRLTLNRLTAARLCPVQLWCAPNTRHTFFTACRRDYGTTLRTQRGSGLGQRMHHALLTTLRRSPYAVLIGSDCVSLGVAELRFALNALAAGWDAVLGPAEDGGYLLIGLRRPCAALFRGITWGEVGVLAATRRRLQRAGLQWVELATSWDIDQPTDVRRWKRQQRLDTCSYLLHNTSC